MKLAAAALAFVALGLGSFRLLASDDVGSRATGADEAARSVAAEIQGASAKAKADANAPAWIDAANASCRQDKRALEALGRPRSLDEIVPYLRGVLAIAERSQRRFARIEVPREARRHVARLNRSSAAAMRLLRGMLRAAERRDTAALLERTEDAIALAHRLNPYVRRLGLHDCALPPTGLPA